MKRTLLRLFACFDMRINKRLPWFRRVFRARPGSWCAMLAFLVVGTCLPQGSAMAWNAAGHRLSAEIAWRQMDDASRQKLGRLLLHHPDYPAWIARARLDPMADETSRAHAAFVESSTWADDIKRDARFDDEDHERIAEGDSDWAQHRRWHYADQPLFARPPPWPHSISSQQVGDGELPLRLPLLMQSLTDKKASLRKRAYALVWLMHLVADAHQPLHTVSRIDHDGVSDNGGNGLWVKTPFHPRLAEMSLHAYWDDLPGPPWLRGQRLMQRADQLLATEQNTAPTGNINTWLAEGRELASSVVYAGLSGEIPTLSADYHTQAQATANQQIVTGGKRLAVLLESILGAQAFLEAAAPATPSAIHSFEL